MKTGVLTFHRCINYGSYWQARCLVQGLRALGHDAVLLDHASRRVDVAEWRCAFRPTLPERGPAGDRPAYRRKLRRFFEAFEQLPLSTRFPLDEPARMPDCGTVVVGSDEVWNLSHPWYRHPVFYGEGIRAERLLSYAASFGNHEAPSGLEPAWTQRLRSFDWISVRDEVSRAIVRTATGIDPDLVLDPCLQFPLEPDHDCDELPRRAYVAVYGHGFSAGFAEHVVRWARRRRREIVSIGYRNDWADRQWIDAGPHAFAHFIAGAQAVATNFFHGCVFALRNGKPFACEATPYRGNKLRCLMAAVGGERHLVDAGTDTAGYDALLDAPPLPAVQRRIDRLRERSSAYLAQALAAERRTA